MLTVLKMAEIAKGRRLGWVSSSWMAKNYKDRRESHDVVDPIVAPLIQEAFEMAAKGTIPTSVKIPRRANSKGLAPAPEISIKASAVVNPCKPFYRGRSSITSQFCRERTRALISEELVSASSPNLGRRKQSET